MPFDNLSARPLTADQQAAMLLRQAKCLISRPENWCAKYWIKDCYGTRQYCALGAVMVADGRQLPRGVISAIVTGTWYLLTGWVLPTTMRRAIRALDTVARQMEWHSMLALNDRLDHRAVIYVFDRAIEQLEAPIMLPMTR